MNFTYSKIPWKYRNEKRITVPTLFKGFAFRIENSGKIYGSVDTDGKATIEEGYASDGCSGPTLDDKTNILPGFIHDLLYQGGRERKLPQAEDVRKLADQAFHDLLLRFGMPGWRAQYYYWGVRIGGKPFFYGQSNKTKLYTIGIEP